jgi:hypothetical protein
MPHSVLLLYINFIREKEVHHCGRVHGGTKKQDVLLDTPPPQMCCVTKGIGEMNKCSAQTNQLPQGGLECKMM